MREQQDRFGNRLKEVLPLEKTYTIEEVKQIFSDYSHYRNNAESHLRDPLEFDEWIGGNKK